MVSVSFKSDLYVDFYFRIGWNLPKTTSFLASFSIEIWTTCIILLACFHFLQQWPWPTDLSFLMLHPWSLNIVLCKVLPVNFNLYFDWPWPSDLLSCWWYRKGIWSWSHPRAQWLLIKRTFMEYETDHKINLTLIYLNWMSFSVLVI